MPILTQPMGNATVEPVGGKPRRDGRSFGQPNECFEASCPLAGVATGFCLGSGDTVTAKFGLMLEAPGGEEVTCDVEPVEVERRRRSFPHLDERFLRRGKPVVGKAGAILFGWGLGALEIRRDACFIDNGLRCLPPKGKQGPYPTGATRLQAEACCRQWDRWTDRPGDGGVLPGYNPTHSLISIHPAAVVRDTTPTPLMVRTIEKASQLVEREARPLILFGGKATKLWLGYGENVTRWSGHWQRETERTGQLRMERLRVMAQAKGKSKKLTAKGAIQFMLDYYTLVQMTVIDANTVIPEDKLNELRALVAPKEKTK